MTDAQYQHLMQIKSVIKLIQATDENATVENETLIHIARLIVAECNQIECEELELVK